MAEITPVYILRLQSKYMNFGLFENALQTRDFAFGVDGKNFENKIEFLFPSDINL